MGKNNIFTINGAAPDVGIVSLQREVSILDGENAGRLKSGNMVRDVIGTFYNYAFEVMPDLENLAAYDQLYELITAPVGSHLVSVPFGQGVLKFDAYVANATDALQRATNLNLWKKLAFTVIAMKPQRYYGESRRSEQGAGNKVFTINGVGFNVSVTKLQRKGAVLDTDQSGRSKAGVMSREIIGTYYNYSIELEQNLENVKEYDRLYYILTAPVDSHLLTVPYGQGTLTFQAYITKASDKLVRSNNAANIWKGLTVEFIAMAPARR